MQIEEHALYKTILKMDLSPTERKEVINELIEDVQYLKSYLGEDFPTLSAAFLWSTSRKGDDYWRLLSLKQDALELPLKEVSLKKIPL